MRQHCLRHKRGGDLFRLGGTKPEIGQACLLVALEARNLDRRREASLQFTLIPYARNAI
jgi:hypothetical protein